MNEILLVLKEELGCELPIMYYLIESSETQYHRLDKTAVKSNLHQTLLKLQHPTYKPLSNILLNNEEE